MKIKTDIGIESKRILYSDHHSHDLRLSEQDMGIIQHALAVLEVAYGLEPQYRGYINQAQRRIGAAYGSPVIED